MGIEILAEPCFRQATIFGASALMGSIKSIADLRRRTQPIRNFCGFPLEYESNRDNLRNDFEFAVAAGVPASGGIIYTIENYPNLHPIYALGETAADLTAGVSGFFVGNIGTTYLQVFYQMFKEGIFTDKLKLKNPKNSLDYKPREPWDI